MIDTADDDLRVRGAAINYRLHDIGYAIDLEVAGDDAMPWSAFVDFGSRLAASGEIHAAFLEELEALRIRIALAVERPALTPVHEEYTVFRISALALQDARQPDANTVLTDERLAPLLLGERRALATAALAAATIRSRRDGSRPCCRSSRLASPTSRKPSSARRMHSR